LNLRGLRGKLLLSLFLGVLVFVGLSLYADFSDLLGSLGDFQWALLPAILGLSIMNYVLRFVKWQFYLRLIGVRGLRVVDSLLVYWSGLGMVITPGKVGEWLKSYLLKEVHGTPLMRSAPILIAERLTDSMALLILAAVGLFMFGNLWEAYVVVAVGSLALVMLARHRPTATFVLRLLQRVPVVSRFLPNLEEFYEATHVLLAPWSVLLMTGLSVCSWAFEVIAFYLVLLGLGQTASPELFVKASFILPIATLAAAILFTPGGLGVAEGGITGLSQVLVDMSKSTAAVGTLIIRFGTLWFGVLVGLAAFGLLSRRLALTPEGMLAAVPTTPSAAGAETVGDAPR
jgi:uncharacterized protein (TIRG00374 family)